jgi:phage terminase large subunit
VIHPRCQHLIDELTLYSWKTDPLTGLVLPFLEDRDNHLIDSLRYAVEAVRKTNAPKMVSRPIPMTAKW